MNVRKSSYHHGDLPEHISRIAWDKVLQEGADQLSLRSCARAAGVDPAAVYRHFKSKEDLLARLANLAFSELASAMKQAEARCLDAGPRAALVQIGLAYISYAIQKPHIFQMMFDVAGRTKGAGLMDASDEGRAAYDILVKAVDRLHPKAEPEGLILTLWSTVHGLSQLANAGLIPNPEHLEHLSQSICETVVAIIE